MTFAPPLLESQQNGVEPEQCFALDLRFCREIPEINKAQVSLKFDIANKCAVVSVKTWADSNSTMERYFGVQMHICWPLFSLPNGNT